MFYRSRERDGNGIFDTFCGVGANDLSYSSTMQCSACKLYYQCSYPKLSFTGTGKTGIMLLLPPPSLEEDLSGIPGTSESNRWMLNEIRSMGINPDDCYVVNVIGCYSEKFISKYITYCRARLDSLISELNPKLVIAFGTSVLNATVGVDFTRALGDIEKWRGFCIPYRRWNCWLMHTYSTQEIVFDNMFNTHRKEKETSAFKIASEISRSGMFRLYSRLFRQDIKKAYKHLTKAFPKRPETIIPAKYVSEEETINWIKRNYKYLKENPKGVLVCDLETSGLKCYNNNQFIYTIALLADPNDICISFKLTEKLAPYLRKLFSLKPRVVGANFKFDYTWLKKKLDIVADNLFGDVVVLAHLLDNRDGITSLKFQTYVRYGIAYEDTVHKYLEPSAEERQKHGSNAVNNITNAPIEDLCYYNALDVVYTYFVFKDQYSEFSKGKNPDKWFAYKLFHKGSIALAELEYNGVKMDLNKAKSSMDFCEQKIKEIETAIEKEPFWKEWKTRFGEKASLLSDDQVVKMYQAHGYWAKGISKDSKPVADREFLTKLLDQEPFFQYVLDYREYNKMSSTYLRNYFVETNDDGRIRSFYSLSNVSSYRTSSSSPNMQNQSSRDPRQVELLKSCFVPSKGCYITSMDFSGLENFVSSNLTDDEYMMGTLVGGVDMHKDNAKFMFFVSEEEFEALKAYDEEHHTKYAKTLRNAGKTASFSTLYGAGAPKVADSLWKVMDDADIHVTPTEKARTRVINRLNLVEGYKTYCEWCQNNQKNPMSEEAFYRSKFMEHCQDFLTDFWEVRMKATKAWRDQTWEKFLEEGEIHNPVGTTIRSGKSANMVLNAPAQGSGSCVTLWCVGMLLHEIKKRGLHSKVIMQIHDDIVCEVPEEELDEHLCVQKYVMEVLTQKIFKWLKIPLRVEAEISNVSWADKHGYEDFLNKYNSEFVNS